MKLTGPAIHAGLLGIDTKHDPSWTVERRNGLGEYLVMCFRNKFKTATADGVREGASGGCMIHTPEFPQWHTTPEGASEGFRNDWIHLSGDGIPGLLAHFELPVNVIFSIRQADLIEPFLLQIQREQHANDLFSGKAISLLVESMLLALGRQRRDFLDKRSEGTVERVWKDIMLRLKGEMRRTCREAWSVKKMAGKAGLSLSRFTAVYTQLFKVSPGHDLLFIRLTEAKMLLSSTNMKVAEVAETCGFSNVYYFSRAFKKHIGMPPSEFARTKGMNKRNG